ncbi:MAG: 3-deoxy-8-phosphooctulonate synthase [Planctomycetales bacterium 4484_123]|nr:MAG: 3-deoxy-8-phosphooctulonate synthase [Planctomycetales bacterium 4484_123]
MSAEPPTCRIGAVEIGAGKLALIAGPCLAESLELCLAVAEHLASLCEKLQVGYVFKASYDKANRTSVDAARGPGLRRGLEWLDQVRRKVGVPVLSDVHDVSQVAPAAEVLDCLQVPAFLCRQTDLLLAAGRCGRPVNIKKGQFVAPWKMRFAVEKVRSTGNQNVLVTERGTSFGYDLLVNDFRAIPIMRPFAPVVFDATHSTQQLGSGGQTGGQRQFVPTLAAAALAAGADALFIETHPRPEQAASDAASQWPLKKMEELLERLLDIFAAARDN